MDVPLTIGFATYRDPEGVWGLLSHLRGCHGAGYAILCVDNAPEPCPETRTWVTRHRGTYVHRPDLAGTAPPRDHLFRIARTPWVMSVDSHVTFETGAVAAALEYAAANPNSVDLIQGPLVNDDGMPSTHWRPYRPNAMWGRWATAWRTAAGVPFGIRPQAVGEGLLLRTETLDGTETDPAAYGLPADLPWDKHEVALAALGCTRGGAVPAAVADDPKPGLRTLGPTEDHVAAAWMAGSDPSPFEIPMQGLGQFMMRAAAWPGFHPLFAGFGGEEGYIHQKVRMAGGRCLCLPRLRWRHRFRHTKRAPGAKPLAPYPLTQRDHVRNLLLAHLELGVPGVDQIYEEYGTKLDIKEWERVQAEVEQAQPWGDVRSRPARLKVLARWTAAPGTPAAFAQRARQTVGEAAAASRHRVTVGGPDTPADGYDVVATVEDRCLYPGGHFDRLADALSANPAAGSVCAPNVIGLDARGWVRARVGITPAFASAARPGAASDAPQVRLSPIGLDPVVRYCEGTPEAADYAPPEAAAGQTPKPSPAHPVWGPAVGLLPKAVDTPAPCKTCPEAAPRMPVVETDPAAWYAKAAAAAGPFQEQLATVRELADGCEAVGELSIWPGRPVLAALLTSKAKAVYSACPRPKPEWAAMAAAQGARLTVAIAEPDAANPPAVDLMVVDAARNATAVGGALRAAARRTRRYVAVLGTTSHAEQGEGRRPGVLPAVRGFLKAHPEWTSVRTVPAGTGMMVLSRDDRDKDHPPGVLVKALNFTKALAAHAAAGGRLVTDEVHQARLELCVVCPRRWHDTCGACGCPVDKKASWASSECPACRYCGRKRDEHTDTACPGFEPKWGKDGGGNGDGPDAPAGPPPRPAVLPTPVARAAGAGRPPQPVVRQPVDLSRLQPGEAGARFNASLFRYKGRLLMAYRTGWSGARIHVATMAEDYTPGPSVTLDGLGVPGAEYGQEDPRLFVHRGRLHVGYIGVEVREFDGLRTNQLYAELTDDLKVAEVYRPEHPARQPAVWEKNWVFFSRDDVLYAVYKTMPHQIVRVDGVRVTDVANRSFRPPWSGGHMRGGASPVLVGDSYYHWFHGRVDGPVNRYNIGVVVFDAAPPFAVRRMTPNPLLAADAKTKPADQYASVVFPCGAVLENGLWRVSYGVHDRWIEVAEWDAAAVDAYLVDAETRA